MATALTRRNFLAFDFGDRRTAGDRWIRIHRVAMACRFEVMLSDEDARDVAGARAALDEADALESLLTDFRETGPVVDLNQRAAAEDVVVDPTLFSLLARSADLHAATGGAFDITSMPFSRCWDGLPRTGRVPSDASIADARAVVGMPQVQLDAARGSVRFARAGVEVDFGAIGKGFALDRMRDVLRAQGIRRALLSAGRSSVRAFGGRGRGWPVDLRPRLASRRVGRLWIREGAVGTSSAGDSFIEVDGQRCGRVIDPRTGRPAAGVLGASVVTGEAAAAAALSSAFLVGGADLARRYCDANPDTLAVLVLDERDERTEVFGACSGAMLEMVA